MGWRPVPAGTVPRTDRGGQTEPGDETETRESPLIVTLEDIENPEFRAEALAFSDRGNQQHQYKAVLDALGPIDGLTLLDVGCGTGDFSELLPSTVQYLGMDMDKDLIAAGLHLHPHRLFLGEPWIVPADVIVAIGVITYPLNPMPPESMVRMLWEYARQQLVATIWKGSDVFPIDLDTVLSWWPEQTKVIPGRGDFWTLRTRR